MKKSIYYIAFVVMSSLTACTSQDEVQLMPELIYIGAQVESAQHATRAPYSLTSPTAANPLNAAVWMSTTSHFYPDSNLGKDDENATTIAYHNTATFTGENKQLLKDQLYYPSSQASVYFVGLCPQSGWTVSGGESGTSNVASLTFDGKTDVMFAPEVSNSLTTSATYPILQFGHKLTWLRFKFCADSQESIDAWGNVTSLAIKSKKELAVDVATNDVTFSNEGTLPAYITSTDEAFTSKAIQVYTTSVEVAYVLAAPVTATAEDNEYMLVLNTVGRQDIQVPINLTSSTNTDYVGDTTGRQFTITLQLSKGDKITTTATITPWINSGIVIQPVTE